MADYIKREDVLKSSCVLYTHVQNGINAVPVKAIKNIPSADVAEVRHGMWEDDGLVGIGAFGIEYRSQKCSECGYTFTKIPAQLLHKFCPNCGADMRTDGE